jgi:hypothetical protein
MSENKDVDNKLEQPKKKIKKNKAIRCDFCNKKVGLTGIKCRCENLFCGKCITSSVHNCKFNYKKDYQDELKKNLGNGEFSKLNTI